MIDSLRGPGAIPSRDVKVHKAHIRDLASIKKLDLEFEPDVTVIAGPNGVGKTSILRFLASYAESHTMWGNAGPPNPVPIEFTVNLKPSPKLARTTNFIMFDAQRTAGINGFMDWWNVRDIAHARAVRQSLDPTYRDPELAIFDDAIKGAKMLGGKVIASGTGIALQRSDHTLQWHSLSAGEQAMITMIGNIAFQAASQEKESSTDFGMVVLIDEIELHLHPQWQREILPTLLQAFPTFQFIVTTHSPQVVGSVDARSVRLLDRSPDGTHRVVTPIATKGLDSNYILEAIMDANDRDPDSSKAIDAFVGAVETRRFDEAEYLLQKIRGLIEGDPPIMSRLTYQLRLARSRTN